MKARGVFLIVFTCLFLMPTFVAAEEQEPTEAQNAILNYWNIGILVGGTSLVGFTADYFFRDNVLGLSIGMFGFVPCIDINVRHYFRLDPVAFFIGFGAWEIIVIYDRGFGYTTMLDVPLGIDWKCFRNFHLGLEADVNYMLYFRDNNYDTGNREGWFMNFLVLPGIYATWDL